MPIIIHRRIVTFLKFCVILHYYELIKIMNNYDDERLYDYERL